MRILRTPAFWFSIGLNILLYAFYVFLGYINSGGFEWFLKGGDTREYLCYGESLLLGHFHCGDTLFNRMPGYPACYAAFRLLFAPETAKLLLVWLQVLAGALAMFLLSELAIRKLRVSIKQNLLIVFFSSLWVYKCWDGVLLTESLACSTLIGALYLVWMHPGAPKSLLLAGLLFTACVFLRPFAIILMACAGIFILVDGIRLSWKYSRIFKTVLLFSLPFMLIESAWIVRNYKASGKFVPFQESNRYPGLSTKAETDASAYNKIWDWIRVVGEDCVYWNPGSLGSWMFGGEFMPREFVYKKHLVADSYGTPAIDSLRNMYAAQKAASDTRIQHQLQDSVVRLADRMIAAYKSERTFQYYIGSPARILLRSFVHSGPVVPVPTFPAILHSPFLLTVKIYAIFSYWFILCTGLYIMVRYGRRSKEIFLLMCMILSLTAFLGVLLRYTEFRLYNLIFPLLALLASLFLNGMLRWMLAKKGWKRIARMLVK